MRISTITSEVKWLSLGQFGAKYGMTRKSAKKRIEGQGKDCYRLAIIQTPAAPRILDPQLDTPPNRNAEPEQIFILLPSEVATLLEMTKRQVNQLAVQGEIHCRVYGNKRFFPLSEVRRVFAARGKLSESGQGD